MGKAINWRSGGPAEADGGATSQAHQAGEWVSIEAIETSRQVLARKHSVNPCR